MQFAAPHYFYLLWLVPGLVFFFLYAFLRKDRLLRRFCGTTPPERLSPATARRRQRVAAACLVLTVACIVVALARPRWGFHWEDITRRGVDIIVAVDVSRSMLAEDVSPSRLERARREIYDLCAMLEGDRIGLIAFAGTGFVQCPLTLDYGAFRMFLDSLTPDLIPTPGTALGAAIRLATQSFSRRERTSKALILITDGEDHGSTPIEAAREAAKEGVKIYPIGVGRDTGTPIPAGEGAGGFLKDRSGNVVLSRLDEKTLQKIALETGGRYVRSVTGDLDLDTIYRHDIRGTIEKKELKSTRRKRWEERFQWFAAVAVLLLVLEWFIRERH